jgi:tRNA dimethylallyltransferase
MILISGPTASGKTQISLAIAESLQKKFAIINFDSLLFYKELNIGTAKPTKEEQEICPHYLIDTNSISSPMNASLFIEQAKEVVKQLESDGITPILVGGSTFYLRAFIKGMADSVSVSLELREELAAELENKGIEFFRTFLKEHDEASYQSIHTNDHYRIMRAVEHFKVTGSPFSLEKEKMNDKNPYDFSQHNWPGWQFKHIYLDLPKEQHFEFIKERTEKMLESGLEDEVRNLLAEGFSGEEKPMQSIGYKETLGWINKQFKDRDEYRERINISTRQLAKSQRTFLKKVGPKDCFHPLQDKSKIIEQILAFMDQ